MGKSNCSHPRVVIKNGQVYDGIVPHKPTGATVWFECGECGAKEPFEHFSFITAYEYNKARGVGDDASASIRNRQIHDNKD